MKQSLIIILSLVAGMTAGCGEDQTESVAQVPAVFIDRSSKDLFVAPAGTVAAPVNPKTGKPTLAPALYCPNCQCWHQVPPREVLLQKPQLRFCRKDKTPLTESGPLPSSATTLPPLNDQHEE